MTLLTYGRDSLLLDLLVEALTVLEASRVAVSRPLRGIGRDSTLVRSVVKWRCEVLQGQETSCARENRVFLDSNRVQLLVIIHQQIVGCVLISLFDR